MPKMDEEDVIDSSQLPQISMARGAAGPTSVFGGPPKTFGSPDSRFATGSSSDTFPDPLRSNTAAGSNAAQNASILVAADDSFGNFINSKWRPLFAMMYLAACTCDFILFPIAWSILQAISSGQVTSQWQPLTLQGAGLFHLACGAVLGVAAYGRTQEKLAGRHTP